MADLSKIKVGDQLVCTGRVVSNMRESQSALYPLEVTFCDNDEDTSKLSLADVQAAEHIPAPRVFKRRDLVKLRQLDDQWMHGGIVVSNPVRVPEKYEVHFPGIGIIATYPDELEPDEAPE